MTRFKIKYKNNLTYCCVIIWAALFGGHLVECSEFPERECCDLTTTTTVGPIQIPPVLPTEKSVATSSVQTIAVGGRSGSNIKAAIAILNCILARQLCFEDPSCSAILEIIPRVCGPIPVSCSTVTVTKCQAALRTLQAFPFFRPTCLCKEPGVDPDCNHFRDFLFDHPCGFVLKKEKDPYPIDALPTCNHALSVCQQERKCLKLFEDFKTHCKVRDNKCRMDDRDLCHDSWTNLRLSPMFGCICPNNHMKRRCDRIFNVVNHNPCVDIIFLSLYSGSGQPHLTHFPSSSSETSNSVYLEEEENLITAEIFSLFPHFLFPPSSGLNRKIPLALASHSPATDDDSDRGDEHYDDSRRHQHHHHHRGGGGSGGGGVIIVNEPEPDEPDYPHVINPHAHEIDEHYINREHHNPLSNSNHNHRGHGNKSPSMDERVRIMGMDETYHQRIFDEHMAIIDTPLIDTTSPYYQGQHHNIMTYPFNVTEFQQGNEENGSNIYQSGQEPEPEDSTDVIRAHFQSTCHTAMDTCREDPACSTSLQPMLMNCEMHRCNRNACMNSLQAFYKGPHEDLSLDVAFCLCKKTTNRHDMCMIAQEKLHPVCAQRPPDSINPQSSNGIFYHPPPACHVVAELCKQDRECRQKLEYYEQACAVDSVTKKCAGRPGGCRQAMIGILGTSLRTTCACQGTDSQNQYQCLGWRKLLWMNPCVVEAQKDFHMKRLAELGLLITTTTTTTTTTTPTPMTTTTTTRRLPPTTTTTRAPVTKAKLSPIGRKIHTDPPSSIPETIILNGNAINGKNAIGNSVHNGGGSNERHYDAEDNGHNAISELQESDSDERQFYLVTSTTEATTDSTSSTTTTVTTTTQAPKNCVAQGSHQLNQLIPEGSSRRIYSLDDAECSELCACGEAQTLTCHALCVPFAPCRTALAFYSHASPAYQAFRGRCLCYSGRFICMKPPLGEYSLPGGVFLLLGYSATDEALLRPHTNLGVQDAVRALQQYVTAHIDNETQCTLTLFNMTDENIIISARLPQDSKLSSIDLLRKEKDDCTSILKTISHHINTEHAELQAHRLLSIFKMSEVEVVWPESGAAASFKLSHSSRISHLVQIISIAMIPFIRWMVVVINFHTGT